MAGNPQNYLAVIKVVGIGGGGVNAVNRMIDAGLKGVEFIAVNTDAQALLMSDADVKLDIGRELTRGPRRRQRSRGRPAGGRGAPRRDRRGAQGRRHGVHHRRQGRWHRHRCARRSSPRSPRASARSPSASSPGRSRFEGRRRSVQAEQGIQKLKEKVDTLIVIPNDRLLTVSNEKTSVLNAFKMADEVLLQGVQGITDLITTPGLINTDFADVKMIMSNAGSALMGIGYGSGEGRALAAARAAISSPLLEASIEGARGILLNIAGGSDLGLFEVNEAAEVIHGVAHPDANIIFGTVIDDEMGDEVRVTVIAAGFDRWDDAEGPGRRRGQPPAAPVDGDLEPVTDVFGGDDDDDLDIDDERRLRRPVLPEVGPRPSLVDVPAQVGHRGGPVPARGMVGARSLSVVASYSYRTTTRADGDFAIDAEPAGLAARRRAVVDRPWVWLRQVHGRRGGGRRRARERGGCPRHRGRRARDGRAGHRLGDPDRRLRTGRPPGRARRHRHRPCRLAGAGGGGDRGGGRGHGRARRRVDRGVDRSPCRT